MRELRVHQRKMDLSDYGDTGTHEAWKERPADHFPFHPIVICECVPAFRGTAGNEKTMRNKGLEVSGTAGAEADNTACSR